MDKLTEQVEQKIIRMLPEKFALIFDGWSAGTTHYVAIFASFAATNSAGYKTCMLGFSSFEDETSQDTEHHYEFIELNSFVVSVFKKSWQNVAALIGDNCNTNLALGTKVGCGFRGCVSHRFNLAVQDLVETSQGDVRKVRALMKKFLNAIPAAKLPKLTALSAKCNNETRWSSTCEMIDRYQRIREFLGETEIDGIEDMLLTPRENRRIDNLYTKFSSLNNVTKALQSDSTTCADVRALFDAVIEDFTQMRERLKENADIVLCPNFESGVVKVQNGRIGELTDGESEAIACLKIERTEEVTSEYESLSFAERALKRWRIETNSSDYMDLRFLVPTSNVCERIFSKAGFALSDRRKRISCVHFEQQMFLHSNGDLWNIADVDSIIEH